ncbi:MAG: hypothetical protein JWO59_3292 [Chloroflexi bacterium]|nr:hypothetical protein [Chloroflexota bacterium]
MLEQGQRYKWRDEILEQRGERALSGTNLKNLGTGEECSPVPQTTAEVAASLGQSESTFKNVFWNSARTPQNMRLVLMT